MVLNYQTNDAARALDQQQLLDWQRGWQVVDPAGGSNLVSPGTGDFEYDAAAGDINAGGTIVTCTSGTADDTVDFATDIDASDDKMAVIYRDASGVLQKSVGSTGTRDPANEDPRSTHTPPPPTLFNTNGVVLAEVLLPAGASSIGASELRDRRLPAELVLNQLNAQKLSANLDADGNDITGVGSLATENIDTKNQPTGPSGSYVGQRGGIETTIAPSVTLYETQAEPFKKVVYQDGSTLYAVSQDSTGTVYKSTDDGASWSNQGDVGASSEVKVLQRIEATGTLIAFTKDNGVHRSTDDGVNWTNDVHTLAYPPLEAQGVTDTPNGNILVGEYGNDGNTVYEIYRSTDDGQTWSSVLQSNGTAPSPNPGHIQNLQYDPFDNKVVALLDYASPEVYDGGAEGGSFSLIDTADTNKKPNYVSLLFFENYIAWGYDSHPENGWIRRMSRTDFYDGSWTDDMVEDVAKVNDKMCYYSLPIESDMWLTAWASESNEHPGSYAQEHYLVYDDGSKVTSAFEHATPTADVNSPLGQKSRLAGYPHDSKGLGSTTWVNLNSASLPRGFSAVPLSVGENNTMPKTVGGAPHRFVLPNNTAYGARDSSGTIKALLDISDQDWTRLRGQGNQELRGYSGGLWAFLHGGALTLSIRDGEVDLDGSDLTTMAKYSDDSNPPNDCLYYDTTDTRLEYKDDGGTIHNLG